MGKASTNLHQRVKRAGRPETSPEILGNIVWKAINWRIYKIPCINEVSKPNPNTMYNICNTYDSYVVAQIQLPAGRKVRNKDVFL